MIYIFMGDLNSFSRINPNVPKKRIYNCYISIYSERDEKQKFFNIVIHRDYVFVRMLQLVFVSHIIVYIII